MVIAEISVISVGSVSQSHFVSRVIKIIERSGIRYQLTPMGTVLEGESIEEILDIVRRVHEELSMDENVQRILTTLKIDDRKDKKVRMEDKIKSVREKLD